MMYRHEFVTPSERRWRSSDGATPSPSSATSPGDTAVLVDNHCPLCAWFGRTDRTSCPRCGHGLLTYEITYHD